MHFARIAFLFAAFAAWCPICRAQGEGSNSKIYPPGWEDIVSAWRQMEEAEYNETGSYVATVESRMTEYGTGKVFQMSRVWSVQTKPGRKRFTKTSKVDRSEEVCVRTPDYAFEVNREQQEQPWKLVLLTKGGTSDDARHYEAKALGRFYFCLLHPLGTLMGKDLCSKHFYEGDGKGFQELKLMEEEKPRLEWKSDADSNESLIMEGPPYYIPRQFEWRFNDGKSTSYRTTFVRELLADGKRPASPLPLCKSIAYKLVDDKKGGEIVNHVNVVFSDYSFDPPPDEIFSLSYYGLPETLAETHAARSKLWLWLLAAAAGCLVLALLARRLARRNA